MPASSPRRAVRVAARRTSPVGALVGLGLAVVAVWTSAGSVFPARATEREAAEAPRPIWTTKPVRIDRRRDTRERVPGLLPSPVLRLRVSDFPRVDEDCSFSAEGRRWRIAHVRLPEASRICVLADGRRWACGLRARARFSALVAGARLDCDPPVTGEVPTVVSCRSSGRPVADRLIEAGWAEPDGEAPEELFALAQTARAAGRGVHAETIPP